MVFCTGLCRFRVVWVAVLGFFGFFGCGSLSGLIGYGAPRAIRAPGLQTFQASSFCGQLRKTLGAFVSGKVCATGPKAVTADSRLCGLVGLRLKSRLQLEGFKTLSFNFTA